LKRLISIIIPVYNEEENIDRIFAALKDETSKLDRYDFEFIFTDNCSTDDSFAQLLRLSMDHPNIRIARFSRNFGFHKSVLTGYRLANGDAAIQIDADLQDPPEIFEKFLALWEEGHDVVVGIRRKRKENVILQLGRKMHYRLLARLAGSHLIADAGDFRLVDSSLIKALRQINDTHPYLRGLISSLARNQTGVVYDRNIREHGESKFPIKNLFRMGSEGIIAHSRLPLKFSFIVATLTPVFAVIAVGFYLSNIMTEGPSWPPGLATTIFLILISIGLNGFFMGVMGAYVGRIYDQVRQRPTTVISDLINFETVPDQALTFSISPPSANAKIDAEIGQSG